MIMKHIFNYIFFSTLNNVIGKKTNCLNVNKFSLLQTVKFDLQARKVSSVSWYRDEISYDFLSITNEAKK